MTLGVVVVPAVPAQAADGTLTFFGHGWGHGRGMGQYGALGYAVDHGWEYRTILAHYYGGTTLAGDAGNPIMTVELTAALQGASKDLIVTAPGLTVNGAPTGSAAVLIRRTSPGTFTVHVGAGCGGPTWTPIGTRSSGLIVASAADPAEPANLLRVCTATTTVGYRGTLSLVDVGGTVYAVNSLPTESYLRGVVPRESPSSWGDAGGGRGMQALKAQAVAARSYALAGSSRASGAKTCDTTACQVYGGAFTWPVGGARTMLEAPPTDSAIAQTAGQVMRSANGTIARTEFSSSTGGYTAGGTFPAVQDLGDGTASNPNHNWSTPLSTDAIAAKLGTGPIASLTVTGRNGLGADGGRVTEVTVITVDGARRSFTGNQVRVALGLKSDWFSVSGVDLASAQAIVRALYADILHRQVDPSGMATWTGEILRTQGATSTARALAYSDERLYVLVADQYQLALHRGPEPAGQAFWVRLLQSGWSVPDLQAGIFASDEALMVLGGGDLATWVGGMYATILGRQAAPAEAAWWVAYTNAHGRYAAVSGIARSEEAANRRLSGYYQSMLGREPDPSGIATFVPLLMIGQGDLTIPVLLGESPEYAARALTRF